MDVLLQILASGLTLGAVYAISTVGLALVFGAMNMLNMSHGALMALGGYMAWFMVTGFGLPPVAGMLAAVLVCAAVGVLIYLLIAKPMLQSEGFETRIFIATIGFGAMLESVILMAFGPQPKPQPLAVQGGFSLAGVHLPIQNLLILVLSMLLMAALALLLQKSRIGRAIRATAQNRDAARLMGVRIGVVYALVLGISGGLAAISGITVSSLSSLLPNMGGDPMLKAFIICVVAGLGRVPGSVIAALFIGLFEAVVQYTIGVRFSFALLLLLVIVVLIWKPQGVFGRQQGVRL
ncbi:branched-chain amino acid ABC transporter permease [Paracoccus methylovorus]|jgi:branched-subunit amino acid ABC-type transport system permease component|uniref:Amino acid/amide ABC transporter membrane protein 1, HAAT family n=3 Tax=Paracoccus TaxID=265 RepID=A1B6J4_PARDP|nr:MULTISPECIES: branched-chain amino acid ABC transporter permease [Paracoccus]ABL71138.1 amino acid/amide ABC transporter membrane protein 1, HAAT family [Paracoccus denitrificans PD1222]MCU7429319.1 branched-chain amino acid ABC transporter permease [Paracoccus denitrificans]MDK8873307.1 branched-chain amino acid ABC transporter permease [Paracoccus sp. SSJ]QAR27791.1 branched-chain amino acid ABC transporter permease [Paracoccus denitrificans]QLH14917.1 branched-chain amino acid ABC transp